MIYALLMRRIWLWQNRLLSSIVLLLALPVLIYGLISVSFKNIMVQSLSGVPFDIWVIPGLIFIISSLGLFPLLYRDFFDLRIHRKVLVNVALAPYRKRELIGGYLCVAGIEAFLIGIISLIVISGFTAYSYSLLESFALLLCLVLYLFLLGNLFISMGLLIDTVTTLFLMTALNFIFLIFGNGFIIEFGFFPVNLATFLKWLPLSIPFQIFQLFNQTGLMDWALFAGLTIFGLLWTLANTSILKRKLQH